MNNLAGLYLSQGRYVEAEPLFRHAVDGLRIVLGEAHPYFKIVAENHERCLAQLRNRG